MSPATVQRIVAAWVLTPPRLRYFLTRPDPLVAEKRAEIVDLSWQRLRGCWVVWLEEKPPSQALERWHPVLPLRPGLVERQEGEDGRQGTVERLAAFEVLTGEVFAQGSRRPPKLAFRHCWRPLRARASEGRWPLSGDTASSPKKPTGLHWGAAQRPAVTLHWVPAPGSWLKQGEIEVSLVSRKGLCRASGRATPALCNLLPRFLTTWHPPLAPPCEWPYPGKPLAVAPPPYGFLAA